MTERWKLWLADTLERVLSTAAQAAVAAVVVTGWTVDTLYVVLGAAGLSLLKCFAALGVGAPDSASLLPADTDPPKDEGGHSTTDLLTVIVVAVLVFLALSWVLHHNW